MINTKLYVDELYEREFDIQINEASISKITIRCTVDSAAMFNAIANRFGITRFELLEPFLNDLSRQLFISLHEEDILEIAKAADIEATKILQSQGVTINNNPVDGSTHWRSCERAFLMQKEYEAKQAEEE